MLDASRDDVIALVAKREESPLERKVVCFAAATCENDLVIVAAEQRRDLAARAVEGRFSHGRRPMPARWIAVMIREKRAHYGGHPRIDRRARVVIEIDGLHG